MTRGAAIAFLTILLAGNAVAQAQALRITNEAGGVACYRPDDLMSAHSALGFYNLKKVRALVVQDRCFTMGKHWRARLIKRRRIMGVDVVMVKVRPSSSRPPSLTWPGR